MRCTNVAKTLRLWCRQQHAIRAVEIAEGKIKEIRDYHRPLPVMATYVHSVLLLHDDEHHLVFPRPGEISGSSLDLLGLRSPSEVRRLGHTVPVHQFVSLQEARGAFDQG